MTRIQVGFTDGARRAGESEESHFALLHRILYVVVFQRTFHSQTEAFTRSHHADLNKGLLNDNAKGLSVYVSDESKVGVYSSQSDFHVGCYSNKFYNPI